MSKAELEMWHNVLIQSTKAVYSAMGTEPINLEELRDRCEDMTINFENLSELYPKKENSEYDFNVVLPIIKLAL